MCYQEKWENGILYVKTFPTSKWKRYKPTLAEIFLAVKNNKIDIEEALLAASMLDRSF